MPGQAAGAIYIYNASPRVLNSTVDHSGSQGVYVYSGSMQLAGSTIRNSATYGLLGTSCGPALSGNTFTGNTNYDIYITSPTGGSITGNTLSTGLYLSSTGMGEISGNAITYNPAYPLRLGADDVGKLGANRFSNVGPDAYLDVVGGTVSKDAVWLALMPYHILGAVNVKGVDGPDALTTLTIRPGAELRFNQSTNLTIGATTGDPGALVAKGTRQNPIVFTANLATPFPGSWYGIYFQDTAADVVSVIQLSRIEYAGNAIILNNAKPAIQGNILRYNNIGLNVNGAGSDGTLMECNTITGNDYGIYLYAALPLAHYNDLVGNGQYSIYNVSAGMVNAENNWWGGTGGPGAGGNNVHGNVDYSPWSTALNDCSGTYDSSDTTPPTLVSMDPADGTVRQSIAGITFTLHDQGSAINDFAVINSVTVRLAGGHSVAGTTTESADTFVFTPGILPLPDGDYQITFTAADIIGNEAGYSSSFTIDTQAPAKPVITGGLIASGKIRERPAENIAGTASILLTGTAESGTTLWINGTQKGQVASGAWSATLGLAAGANTFEVWVEDGAGLRSPSAWVDIWLESGPMVNLEYDEAGRLNRIIPHQD